jgi:uracil-DNA glycosylase family 4
MKNCRPYLKRELEILQPKVIVVLGRIAFEAVLRICHPISNLQAEAPIAFSHAAVYHLHTSAFFDNDSDFWLVCSYHPSRQNTQTGRLTVEMFDQVWKTVRDLLEQ